MSDEQMVRFRPVPGSSLPTCAGCGRRVLMVIHLGAIGRGEVELCLTCDQNRPARAAWLDYLDSGRAATEQVLTPYGLAEAKRLWGACFLDVLAASPLGLPISTSGT
ncbi:hypothetical protein [Nonomuraea sp. NPDC050310]|uniref:hypothetical protein n=1 Tax=Nonomuraea sp. NPDC050310 TaxID=3154935 RepID=UPI0033EBA7B2